MQTDSNWLKVLILCGILFSGLIFLARSLSSPALMTDSPYYHLRIAGLLVSGSIDKDPGVIQDFSIHLAPYDVILAFCIFFLNKTFASVVLPAFFSIFSLVLIFMILRRFGFRNYIIYSTLFVFAVSPVYIYGSTVSSDVSASFFFQLLAAYFFLVPKPRILFSAVLFGISGLSAHLNLLVMFIFLIGVYIAKVRNIRQVLFILVVSSIISIPFLGYTEMPFTSPGKGINSLITDFGSMYGLSFFILAFGLWGFVLRFSSSFGISLCLLSTLLLSLYSPYAHVYSGLILSYYTAHVFWSVFSRPFAIAQLRVWCLLLFFCCLLFSSLVYTTRLVNVSPSDEDIQSMVLLSYSVPANSSVLTSPENANMVAAFGMTPFIDLRSVPSPVYDEFLDVMGSYDLKFVSQYLSKNSIEYIFITPSMVEGSVWNKKDQGFYYLLENSETFKNIFETDGYGLWEVRINSNSP